VTCSAKLDIQNREYRKPAGGNVITCLCGHRHVYPAKTPISYLLDQCDLHDEIGNIETPQARRRRERMADAQRGSEARAASNLKFERN
jgi:hypothetical protein